MTSMFITKKKHLEIVAAKDAEIERLKENRDLSCLLREITGKLLKQDSYLFCADGSPSLTYASIESSLSDSIPRLLTDFFGGKVMKHEATKVVVLDNEGNATFGWTKRKADKGFKYLLVRN